MVCKNTKLYKLTQFVVEFYCFIQNKVENFRLGTIQSEKSALYKSSAVTAEDGKDKQGGFRFDSIADNWSFVTHFFEIKSMQFCLIFEVICKSKNEFYKIRRNKISAFVRVISADKYI